MNLASISEDHNVEKRIAITPEIAKKYISLGFNLTLSSNYGTHLGFSDEDYKNLGVNFLENEDEIIKNSEIVIQLGLPDDKKLSQLKENQKIEKRIAITPEIAKKYISLGFDVQLSKNYGTHLGITDDEYKKNWCEVFK